MVVPSQAARGTRKRHFSFKIATRKCFFFIHLWVGLVVGLYFSAVGLTGSVLVFREDWDVHQAMPERSYVAPPTPKASLLPLSETIARLRTTFPQATEAELAFLTPPPQKGGAYLWRLSADKKALQTTVNPYTGAVIHRYAPGGTFMAWADDLHTDLLFRQPGRLANGYGALLSTLLLLSGLWLWWPATKKQIKIRFSVKRVAGPARLISDLHNVLGSYLFLLLLVTTFSGAVIVFNRVAQKQVNALFGSSRIPPAPRVTPPPGKSRLPVEVLVRIAEEASPPGSHFVFITYPTRENQPLYAYNRASSGILPDSRVYIDPYTGAVLQVGRDISDPRSKQIMRSNAALHFGRWGGLPMKIVYSLTGLLPLGLFVTGVLMSVRRWRSQAASRKRRAPLQQTGRFADTARAQDSR